MNLDDVSSQCPTTVVCPECGAQLQQLSPSRRFQLRVDGHTLKPIDTEQEGIVGGHVTRCDKSTAPR